MKLDPRAHIGYLVGYNSTNIYRVWIPYKGIVISTRDMIFDEYTFTGERPDHSLELISELDTLIKKVKITTVESENKSLLREDDEVPETDSEPTGSDDDAEPIQDLNQTEDLELAKAMEEAYMTPPQMDDGNNDSPCAFYIPYQYNQSVRGCTRIAQAVESQKTVIEYNRGPVSPGPHRVLYTGAQDSDLLCHDKPSPERGATPSFRTTHGGGPEGWHAVRRFLPIGCACPGAGGRPGSSRALTGREAHLRLGTVQAILKGSPHHTEREDGR
jgi:hypothetical protein